MALGYIGIVMFLIGILCGAGCIGLIVWAVHEEISKYGKHKSNTKM